MRIFNFWNRPILFDTASAAWQEGGLSGMFVVLIGTLVVLASTLPTWLTSIFQNVTGTIFALLIALSCAYVIGGIYALVFRCMLRLFWRRLGYVGSMLSGIAFASLLSWYTFYPLTLEVFSIEIPMTYSVAAFHIAFIVMGGRGAAKLYNLWSTLYPSPPKSILFRK